MCSTVAVATSSRNGKPRDQSTEKALETRKKTVSPLICDSESASKNVFGGPFATSACKGTSFSALTVPHYCPYPASRQPLCGRFAQPWDGMDFDPLDEYLSSSSSAYSSGDDVDTENVAGSGSEDHGGTGGGGIKPPRSKASGETQTGTLLRTIVNSGCPSSIPYVRSPRVLQAVEDLLAFVFRVWRHERGFFGGSP